MKLEKLEKSVLKQLSSQFAVYVEKWDEEGDKAEKLQTVEEQLRILLTKDEQLHCLRQEVDGTRRTPVAMHYKPLIHFINLGGTGLVSLQLY